MEGQRCYRVKLSQTSFIRLRRYDCWKGAHTRKNFFASCWARYIWLIVWIENCAPQLLKSVGEVCVSCNVCRPANDNGGVDQYWEKLLGQNEDVPRFSRAAVDSGRTGSGFHITCDAGGEKPFSRCFITRQAMGLFNVEFSDSLSGDGDLRHTSSDEDVQLMHDTPQWVAGIVGQEAATAAAAACE